MYYNPKSENKYLEDDYLDGLCKEIIHYSSLVKEAKQKPLKYRLWDGAHLLIQNSSGNEEFHNRVVTLSETNRADALYSLFKECIDAIVKVHKSKERVKKVEWNESKNLRFNGLLFRESVDGKVWSLKSNVEVLIGLKTDFKKLITFLGVEMNEITYIQFNKLIQNMKLHSDNFTSFKSIRIMHEPFKPNNSDEITMSENIIYDLDNGFVRKKHPAEEFKNTYRSKSQNKTLDVFDGLD